MYYLSAQVDNNVLDTWIYLQLPIYSPPEQLVSLTPDTLSLSFNNEDTNVWQIISCCITWQHSFRNFLSFCQPKNSAFTVLCSPSCHKENVTCILNVTIYRTVAIEWGNKTEYYLQRKQISIRGLITCLVTLLPIVNMQTFHICRSYKARSVYIYQYMVQTKHDMGCSKVLLAVNETITKFYNVRVSTVNENERKYYHALGGKKIYFCITVPKS